MINWKIKENRYGGRFVEEPTERVDFRKRCRHLVLGCSCDKAYYSLVQDKRDKRRGIVTMLFGCSPDVMCPRLRRWDRKHGLEMPYTMVEKLK